MNLNCANSVRMAILQIASVYDDSW